MVVKKMKAGWFQFWIKSNRGTNQKTYVHIKSSITRDELRCKLEKWCGRFGAWTIAEHISYGWKRISPSKLPVSLRNKK